MDTRINLFKAKENVEYVMDVQNFPTSTILKTPMNKSAYLQINEFAF